MRKTNRNERGFSLLETLVSLGVIMVVMGMAVVKELGTLESYQMNAAEDVVVSQMRVARQLAISQRRVVIFQIDTAAESDNRFHVKYQVQPALTGTSETAGKLISVPLPTIAQVTLEPGVPDTPMGFGNSTAVYIGNVSGGPPVMQFNPTGTFTDQTGNNMLNGTIFLGMANNNPLTARAITVMGGTGRVRGYRYVGGTIGWYE